MLGNGHVRFGGQPGETTGGNAHTARVDTSRLRPQSDKLYAARDTFAYEIATVIMGCWTGG